MARIQTGRDLLKIFVNQYQLEGSFMNLTKISIAASVAALLVSASAVAAQPGYFAGATLGYSKTHVKNVTKNDGLGFGLNGGYNFSKYYGVEASLNNLAPVKVAGTKTKFYDLDVTANGYLPVYNKIDLVGKAGLAYVRKMPSVTSNRNFLRPKLAVGVSYAAAQNISVTATYSRIFKQGTAVSNKQLPNLDMTAVAVDYSF